MDKALTEGPDGSATSAHHNLRFEGSAGEYFGIWIVNLALTVVTLGIFSAWAKVRSRRYFLGNTYIGQHAFDYHAQPLRILLGRAIALALLLGYSLTANFAPKAVFLWIILFAAALPWLVKSSLRFNARNTSFRNVRFDFAGTYGGALKAFVLWPILSGITLFTTLPLAHRARDYYMINNHRFGDKAFHAIIPGKKIYVIYGLAVLILIAGMIAGLVAVRLLNANLAENPLSRISSFSVAIVIWMVIALVLLPTLIGTMTFNLSIRSTVLDKRFSLISELSPLRVLWIVISNLLAVLCSLGLAYPWTQVRLYRYRVENLALSGPADLGDFGGALMPTSGAIGEEVASFFDIDFGL